MTPYLICKFEKPTLTNLVKESFGSEFPEVYNKKQIDYIWRYMLDQGCQTVLLESEYIDHDYLDDYTRYYVKGFNNSGYKSSRLHFFSFEFDHDFVDKMLQEGTISSMENIKEMYLGFTVVKPLPKTFIGRTCLKVYDDILKNKDKRVLTRIYNANLFGLDLKVNSIAFQEQDKVVAACSSTSVWSALHAIQWKNVRDIPSRSEITSNAINHIIDSSNSFPNKELSNKQILRTIDSEKLRHLSLDVNPSNTSWDNFMETIKIHINSNLPLILGGDVYAIEDGRYTKKGGHAVTVLGYKAPAEKKSDPAIYIHDDRFGPFVKGEIKPLRKEENSISATWGLFIQEKDDEQKWQLPHEVLIPNSLICVKHPKVRLSYIYPVNTCEIVEQAFNTFIEKASAKSRSTLKSKLHYSISLAEISDIKREFKDYNFEVENDNEEVQILQKYRANFLTHNYARFQWVCKFTFDLTMPIVDILIDATDIPQGNAVTAILVKNSKYANILYKAIRESNIPSDYNYKNGEHFYFALKHKITTTKQNYDLWLDDNYGELRSPKYLKPSEFNKDGIAGNPNLKTYYVTSEDKLSDLINTAPMVGEHNKLIWAISHDGALLIGTDEGHPTLTGSKPARIAGELLYNDGSYIINSKSGRYSRGYDLDSFLNNAILKFRSVFINEVLNFQIQPFSDT